MTTANHSVSKRDKCISLVGERVNSVHCNQYSTVPAANGLYIKEKENCFLCNC